ncbi:MAG: hypothetical protein INH41_08905 [Myxococcaceae bacterium]|jgi:hypothetical protein|nr:hypothetical protein [Myxococcaceae bacterium]MCA3012503.1 hypothetical protein [Myxococcaceae bacterium]
MPPDALETNAFLVVQQLIYLTLSLAVTVWVGRTLFKSGRVFLVDTFKGREALADAVNHLLVVGFYLVNAGWVIRGVKQPWAVRTVQDVIQNVASDVGTVLLVLGVMHFGNVWLFNRIRTRARDERRDAPPVRPSEFLRAPPAAVGEAP